MAQNRVGEIALLSVKPEFADGLLSGSKRVEFRKKGFGRDVSHLALYSTKPVGMVVGLLKVDRLDVLSPDLLWRKYGAVGGIDRARFFEYFFGVEVGVGIVVSDILRFPRALSLYSDLNVRSAPQSYRYLDECQIDYLFGLVLEHSVFA